MSAKKTRRDSRELDLVTDTVAMLLKLAFAGALFSVVNPYIWESVSSDKSPEAAIGIVSDKSGRALIQGVSEFNWNLLPQGFVIHNNDRIYTDDNTKVQIRLGDNSIIDISPNSLLAIRVGPTSTEVDISAGKAQISLLPGQAVLFQDGKFLVAKQRSQIYVENLGDNLILSVNYGDLGILDRKTNKMLPFISHVPSSETAAKISLLAPNGPISIQQNEKVRFDWKWLGSPMEWAVELSRNEDFSFIDKKIIAGNKQTIQSDLSSGQWFWRVVGKRAYNDKEYLSSVGRFELLINTEPSVERTIASRPISSPRIEPPSDIRFKFLRDIQRTLMTWIYGRETERYHLVINCPGENESAQEYYAGQNFAALDFKPYKDCKIKVRSLWPQSTSPWSQPVPLPKSK